MTKREKLIERFLSMPSDFTYDELVSLLKRFGYQEDNKGKTSGSKVSFERKGTPKSIVLHKPHRYSALKRYQLKQAIEQLKEAGLL